MGAGVLAYLIVVGLAAAQMTFYWDDHFFILTEMDRGLGGALLTGINGHWWPVSTLILAAQTRVFGFWYPGYLLTNAALVLWIAWLAWRILTPVVIRGRRIMIAALVVFVTSFGVVVNITVITTAWPLSVALAMLAALLISRDRAAWTWILALVLSFLSGSGLFVINAVAAAALFLVARSGGTAGGWRLPARDLLRAVVVVVAGALGTLLGKVLTDRDPINYYGTVDVEAAPGTGLLAVDAVQITQSIIGNTIAWAASPVLPGTLVLPKAMPWLMILVSTYFAAAVVGLVLVAVLGWQGMRQGGPQWFIGLRARVPVLLALLMPTLAMGAVIATVRTSSMFAPRFWLLWLLPAAALWVILLEGAAVKRVVRAGALGVRLLLVASAVIGALALPWTLRNAADVDKARLASTVTQFEQAARCVSGLPAEPVEEIAPGVTAENYCRMVVHLQETSLVGRLFGYPSGVR